MNRVVILLISTCLLTGCWDRREINDVAFVSGSGIDLKDDQYRVTVQIPLPGQLGGVGSEGGGGGTSGGKSWYNELEFASSIREANKLQQTKSSREIYFAHRRSIVLGHELAKNGIAEMLDIFVRVPQNRLSALVAVTKGSAADVLSTDVPMEKNPSEMIRELVTFSMQNPRTLKDLAQLLLEDGIELTLPVVNVAELPLEKESGKKTLQLDGLAVFKEDKLVGFLEGDNALGVIYAMNEAKNPDITVSPPAGEGEINVQLPEIKADIKPVVKGDDITIEITVAGKGSITENKSNFDTGVRNNIRLLENKVEAKIKSQIKKGVSVLQKQYRSDAIGFGHHLNLKHPKHWKKIKNRWSEIFPNVKIVVHTKVHIEHGGTLSDPFGVKGNQQTK